MQDPPKKKQEGERVRVRRPARGMGDPFTPPARTWFDDQVRIGRNLIGLHGTPPPPTAGYGYEDEGEDPQGTPPMMGDVHPPQSDEDLLSIARGVRGKIDKRSAMHGALQLALQGATFGFSDELAGAGSFLTGGSYTEGRDRNRRTVEAFRAEHPKAALVAEGVGAVGSSLATGGVIGGLAKAGKLGNALKVAMSNKPFATAVRGGATGALHGIGSADGNTAHRLEGMGYGLVPGLVLGGAAGAAATRVLGNVLPGKVGRFLRRAPTMEKAVGGGHPLGEAAARAGRRGVVGASANEMAAPRDLFRDRTGYELELDPPLPVAPGSQTPPPPDSLLQPGGPDTLPSKQSGAEYDDQSYYDDEGGFDEPEQRTYSGADDIPAWAQQDVTAVPGRVGAGGNTAPLGIADLLSRGVPSKASQDTFPPSPRAVTHPLDTLEALGAGPARVQPDMAAGVGRFTRTMPQAIRPEPAAPEPVRPGPMAGDMTAAVGRFNRAYPAPMREPQPEMMAPTDTEGRSLWGDFGAGAKRALTSDMPIQAGQFLRTVGANETGRDLLYSGRQRGREMDAPPTWGEDPARWAAHTAGSTAVNMAPSVGGAGVGALIGSTLGPGGAAIGGFAGAAVPALVQNIGSLREELNQAGVTDYDAMASLMVGVPMAGVDAFLPGKIGGSLFKHALKSGLGRKIATGAAKGAAIGGATGAIRDGMQYSTVSNLSPETEFSLTELLKRAGTAGAVGTVAGTALGGVTAPFQGVGARGEAPPARFKTRFSGDGVEGKATFHEGTRTQAGPEPYATDQARRSGAWERLASQLTHAERAALEKQIPLLRHEVGGGAAGPDQINAALLARIEAAQRLIKQGGKTRRTVERFIRDESGEGKLPEKSPERKSEAPTLYRSGAEELVRGGRYSIISADNPVGTPAQEGLSSETLERELVERYGRENVVPVEGVSGGESDGTGFMVRGMGAREALEVGRRYGQGAVLTPEGLLHTSDETLNKPTGKTFFGDEAKGQENYTVLRTLDGDLAFSTEYDFKSPGKRMNDGGLPTTAYLNPAQPGQDYQYPRFTRNRPNLPTEGGRAAGGEVKESPNFAQAKGIYPASQGGEDTLYVLPDGTELGSGPSRMRHADIGPLYGASRSDLTAPNRFVDEGAVRTTTYAGMMTVIASKPFTPAQIEGIVSTASRQSSPLAAPVEFVNINFTDGRTSVFEITNPDQLRAKLREFGEGGPGPFDDGGGGGGPTPLPPIPPEPDTPPSASEQWAEGHYSKPTNARDVLYVLPSGKPLGRGPDRNKFHADMNKFYGVAKGGHKLFMDEGAVLVSHAGDWTVLELGSRELTPSQAAEIDRIIAESGTRKLVVIQGGTEQMFDMTAPPPPSKVEVARPRIVGGRQ